MIRSAILTYYAATVLILLAVSGCMTRSSPKVHYYSLLSMEQLGETGYLADLPALRLGIGPVTIVDSLKRTQIVTRVQGNQYHFDEFNRWAGSLDNDLASIVGINLGFLLGTNNVDFYPWRPYFHPTHRVVFSIERLDGELGGKVVLEVRWAVLGPGGSKTLAENRSVYEQATAGAGYSDLVTTESRLVAEFCHELAQAVSQHPTVPKNQ